VLTRPGFAKLEKSAPAHVETVHRLIIDPLTRPQVRQLFDIHRRIKRAIDPEDNSILTRAIAERQAQGRESNP